MGIRTPPYPNFATSADATINPINPSQIHTAIFAPSMISSGVRPDPPITSLEQSEQRGLSCIFAVGSVMIFAEQNPHLDSHLFCIFEEVLSCGLVCRASL